MLVSVPFENPGNFMVTISPSGGHTYWRVEDDGTIYSEVKKHKDIVALFARLNAAAVAEEEAEIAALDEESSCI